MSITLRDVIIPDLPILFEQQLDLEAKVMAAFLSRDREAFDTHWAKIMANEDIILRTIEVDGQLAGHLVSWKMVRDAKSAIGWGGNFGEEELPQNRLGSFWAW